MPVSSISITDSGTEISHANGPCERAGSYIFLASPVSPNLMNVHVKIVTA
jgi:hypothetical protein